MATVLSFSRYFPEGGNSPVVDLPKKTRVMLVAQAPPKKLERWFEAPVFSRPKSIWPR